jgi:hypothetical protein
MIAKLCKIDREYFLHSIENNLIATSDNLHLHCLSRKNCQSIERGYDLDELIDLELPLDGTTGNISQRRGFKKGFEKALELMGDKKFTEKDMVDFGGFCCNKIDAFNDVDDLFKKYQPLQQTEWDVEVEIDEEMEFIFDPTMGISQGHYLDKPKLDPDGCLILKIAK